MNETLNGHFDNSDQARNARRDMIAAGIPQDKIYVDEEKQLIKVIIPAAEARQIREIFETHDISEQ